MNRFKELGTIARRGVPSGWMGEARKAVAECKRLLEMRIRSAGKGRHQKDHLAGRCSKTLSDGTQVIAWINPFGLRPTVAVRVVRPEAAIAAPVIYELFVESGWLGAFTSANQTPAEVWYPASVAARYAGPSEDAIMDRLIGSAGSWDYQLTPHVDGRNSVAIAGDSRRSDLLNALWGAGCTSGRVRAAVQSLLGQPGRGLDGVAQALFAAPTPDTTLGIFERPNGAGWYWLSLRRDGVYWAPMTLSDQGAALETERLARIANGDPEGARQIESYLWVTANPPSGWQPATVSGWPANGIEGVSWRGGWGVSDDGHVVGVCTQIEVFAGGNNPIHYEGQLVTVSLSENNDGAVIGSASEERGQWKPKRGRDNVWYPYRWPDGVLMMLPVAFPIWDAGGNSNTAPVAVRVLPGGQVRVTRWSEAVDASQGASDYADLLAQTYHCGAGSSGLDWQSWTTRYRHGFFDDSCDARGTSGSGGTRRILTLDSVITLSDAITWYSSNHNTLTPVPGKASGYSGGHAPTSQWCDPIPDTRPPYNSYFGANYAFWLNYGTTTYRLENLGASSESCQSALVLPHGSQESLFLYRSQLTPNWHGVFTEQQQGGVLEQRVGFAAWEYYQRVQWQGWCHARVPTNPDWTGEFTPMTSLTNTSPSGSGYLFARHETSAGVVTYDEFVTVDEWRVVDDAVDHLASVVDAPPWSDESLPYQGALWHDTTELTLIQATPSAVERLLVSSAGAADSYALESAAVPAAAIQAGGAWSGNV